MKPATSPYLKRSLGRSLDSQIEIEPPDPIARFLSAFDGADPERDICFGKTASALDTDLVG
jgi:hypothetical protein